MPSATTPSASQPTTAFLISFTFCAVGVSLILNSIVDLTATSGSGSQTTHEDRMAIDRCVHKHPQWSHAAARDDFAVLVVVQGSNIGVFEASASADVMAVFNLRTDLSYHRFAIAVIASVVGVLLVLGSLLAIFGCLHESASLVRVGNGIVASVVALAAVAIAVIVARLAFEMTFGVSLYAALSFVTLVATSVRSLKFVSMYARVLKERDGLRCGDPVCPNEHL